MSRPLPALTIHQPWAWAISGGWKPVENRDWPPPAWLLGRYLAIHAGLRYDEEADADLFRNREALGLPEAPAAGSRIARGAIVAVARVAGSVRVEDFGEDGARRLDVKEIRGQVTESRARELAASPWACGLWLWVLEDVTALGPVPARGLQKLWTVPADVADRVRAAWAEKRAAAQDATGGSR